ncbi:hypothetical protein SLS62_008107 [Diatrype stigma]|uniref:Uncharacterized protein n=1 Tax=Diatrype stigma TaxID=117547 RepID=A0AAN9UMA0_9PEZI
MNENAEERKRVLNVLAQRRYRTPGDGSSEIDDPLLFQDIFGSGLSTDVVLLGEETENLNLDLGLQGWEESMNCTSLGPTTTIMPGLVEGPPPDVDAGLHLDFGSDTASTFAISSSQTPFYHHLPLPISPRGNNSGSAVTPYDISSSSPTTTTTVALSSSSSSSHDHNNSRNNDNDDEGDFFTFPDSYHLPMAELALLRAFGRIGKRLGLELGALWELGARSPFVAVAAAGDKPARSSPSPSQQQQLPPHLQPTRAQSTVPHHPVLDLLPWPVVRDRLITVLSLPEGARPCSNGAGGGGGVNMALVQFSYDMEDAAEGIRIWGGDVYDPRAWEVGQALFERWWFVFDREVVAQSNYWRRLRGAGELCVR